jgi:phage terminase large subunit
MPIIDNKRRYNIIYGGRGAGRSYFAIQWALMLVRSPKYCRMYFMREIFGDIKESLFRELVDMCEALGIEDEFEFNNGNYSAVHKPTGNRIISKGFKKSSGNQTAKMKSIAGATHVIIEEADETARDDFDKLDDSLRTVKVEHIQILLLLNTENKGTWIHGRFFNEDDTPKEDGLSTVIHSNYTDNLCNLNKTYVTKMQSYASWNPEYNHIFVLGNWGGGVKGKVYNGWQIIDKLPGLTEPVYGLDFGFSNDPTALIKVEIHNNKIYCQLLIYQTHLQNKHLIEMFAELGVSKNHIIYADHEPKDIADLQDAGYYVEPAPKGADSIRHGIKKIIEHKVFATEDSGDFYNEKREQVGLWEEVKNYRYLDKKDGTSSGKAIDNYNHALDALRYAVSGHYQMSGVMLFEKLF